VTGPIISGTEREIELAVWRLRCLEAKRHGEALPRRPRRVKGNRHADHTAGPFGWQVGRESALDGPLAVR
jgi:hypothetical protein